MFDHLSKAYDIEELSDSSGFSVRNIRFYIQQKLLPPPSPAMGPDAKYGETHKTRLAMIRHLQSQNHSLAEIRERLNAPDSHPSKTSVAKSSAAEYIRAIPGNSAPPPDDAQALSISSRPASQKYTDHSHWERISLTKDIEIQVRRPLSRASDDKRVEKLIAEAQRIFKKELP